MTGEATQPVDVLLDVAGQMTTRDMVPAMAAALKYLAEIPEGAVSAIALAAYVRDSALRLGSGGGWRIFVEDEDVRVSAAAILAR